jgi:hypothetical protein
MSVFTVGERLGTVTQAIRVPFDPSLAYFSIW